MTQEQKAKAYDELKVKAQELTEDGYIDKLALLDLFPELRESEGERAKKEIIELVMQPTWKTEEEFHRRKELCAWLEKQKPAWTEEDKNMLKWIIGYLENKMLNAPISEERTACKNAIDWLLEKQGEQKSDYKVEPKFHKGDWVVYDHRTYQVVELPKEGYINLGLRGKGKIEFVPSTYCKHWTIQDAKDGDVLYHKAENGIEYIVMNKGLNEHNNIDSYFRYTSINGFGIDIPSVLSAKCDSITPATKKQRDLLFQKMKEAGYEWDADKKELKKIEQKLAWSEEDEYYYGIIQYILNNECVGRTDKEEAINWLKSLKDRVQPKQEWSEEDEQMLTEIVKDLQVYKSREISRDAKDAYQNEIDWLKSLRPQNRWKPSDEQMSVLKEQCVCKKSTVAGVVLCELFHDLKKLTEE